MGQPTSIGGDNVDFIGYLDEASEYINVAYVELWAGSRTSILRPTAISRVSGRW